MKRYIAFLTVVLALAACNKAQPDGSKYQPAPALETSTGTVQFNHRGGEASVSVRSTQPVSASSDRDWLQISVSGRDVVFKAGANESLESRYADIVISAGDASRHVEVIQFGSNTKYLWDEEYSFPYQGGSLELLYEDTPATLKLKITGSEWISAVPENGVLSITVAQNPGSEEREGLIEWKAGSDERTIVIKQALNPSGGDSGGGDSGGGDSGGGDDPGEVSYNSWVGSWSSSQGTFTVSGGYESSGVYACSFDGFSDSIFPAYYNASTGDLEFYSYLLDEEDGWQYWFLAIDSDNYPETGGPNDDIMLASATLNSAHTGFTIVGNEYDAVYSGTTYHEVIVQLLLGAYLAEDQGQYTAGWYTLTDVEPMNLPVSFTKASASSATFVPTDWKSFEKKNREVTGRLSAR